MSGLVPRPDPTGPRGLPLRSAVEVPPCGGSPTATLFASGSPPEPSLRARASRPRERGADLPLLGFSPVSHLAVCGRNHPSVDHPPTCRLAPTDRWSPRLDGRSRALPRFPELLHRWSHLLRSDAAMHRITDRPRGFSPPRRIFLRAGRRRCRLLPTLGFAAFRRADPKADRFPAARTPLEGHLPASAPPRSLAAPAPVLFSSSGSSGSPDARCHTPGSPATAGITATSRLCSDARSESARRPLPVGRGPSSLGFLLRAPLTRRRRYLGRQRTIRGPFPSV